MKPIGKSDSPGKTNDSDGIKLRASFFSISQEKGLDPSQRYTRMAESTLGVLHRRGDFYFHADRRDFNSAMYFDKKRRLLLLISSDEFQAWLSAWTGVNRAERSFAFVLKAIETEALSGNTRAITPAICWHSTPEAIYLSCGDGQAFKITPGKVALVGNGTDGVLFAAGQTLRPWRLIKPKDPFESCRLFREARYSAPHGKHLLRLWWLSMFTLQRCKPPLTVSGPIAAGKTRLATGIFELLGIPPRVTAIHEDGENDFWTAMDAGGVVCFDNADTRVRWFPDALAAASTDGSHEKRQLYTDGRLIRQHARAWVIVTSANPTFAADAGLADRLTVVRLERREVDTAESALSEEIVRNRDAGLSWIAYTLATTLADTRPTPVNLNRRHPDFASTAVRLGRAMKREKETIAALGAAEADKSLLNVQNDEIGAMLIEMAAKSGPFGGTANDILQMLLKTDPLLSTRWTAQRLGKRINKLLPHLEIVLSAKVQEDRSRLVRYSFISCGEGGEDQVAVSHKAPILPSHASFRRIGSQSSPSSPAQSKSMKHKIFLKGVHQRC